MSESTPPAADSADASKGAGGVRLSDGPYRLDGCVHGVLVCDAAGRGIGLAKHLDAGLALRDRLNAERSARLNAERDRDRHREKAGLLREQAELRWAANTRADAADARVKELEEDGDHRAAVLREWHDRAVALESDLATARAERDELHAEVARLKEEGAGPRGMHPLLSLALADLACAGSEYVKAAAEAKRKEGGA